MLVALLVLVGLLFVLSLAVGSTWVPVERVIEILRGQAQPHDPAAIIITSIRLPRAITALLAGAALGVAGLQMQTLFGNPLADPFALGVSSGASLGVAIVVMGSVGVAASLAGAGDPGSDALVTAAAVLGALMVLALVLAVSARVGNPTTVLVLGIMFGYAVSAVVVILIGATQPERLVQWAQWSFGSFSGVTARRLPWFGVVICSGLTVAMATTRQLDALLLGANYAHSMGVDVRRIRLVAMVGASLLGATVTAFCGPISFVGLAVPHVCRRLLGTSDHKVLVPAAVLAGGGAALVAQLVSILPGSGGVLPLNAVTALFGAPVVMAVLMRVTRMSSHEQRRSSASNCRDLDGGGGSSLDPRPRIRPRRGQIQRLDTQNLPQASTFEPLEMSSAVGVEAARPPVLQTRDLAVGYRAHRSCRVVLEGITVSASEGDLVCVVGPNGAGKSTFLRTIAGLQPALSGRVEIAGAEARLLTRLEYARRVAVVLTDRVSVEAVTARRMVQSGRYPHLAWMDRLRESDRLSVERALDAAGARHLAERDFSRLSDGERQRVMIARALAQEPALVVLDEPTAFLDVSSRVEVMGVLRQLTCGGRCAAIVSTHDVELALRIADVLWLLRPGGQLVAGAPEDLIVNGALAHTFESRQLRFVPEERSFRPPSHGSRSAAVRGEGLYASMARAVLQRRGYDVREADRDATCAWIVDVDEEGWRAAGRGGAGAGRDFGSLAAFLGERRQV